MLKMQLLCEFSRYLESACSQIKNLTSFIDYSQLLGFSWLHGFHGNTFTWLPLIHPKKRSINILIGMFWIIEISTK